MKKAKALLERDKMVFFSSWLRQPRKIGGVVPSGSALARAMAAQVDAGDAGYVVELGGGTGSLTGALLEAGVRPERLVVFERDATLYKLLMKKFPGVQVIRGDAKEMSRLLAERGISHVKTVISSLPFLSMRDADKREILRQAFQVMRHAGSFVQYTYGIKSPVSRRLLLEADYLVRPAGSVLLNMPPATLWVYRAKIQPRLDTATQAYAAAL